MEDDLLYLYNQNLANEATDLYDQRQRDLVNQAAMNVFQTGFNNQNPTTVDYGLTSLPEFDMANLPMYEKDDEQVQYLPGQEPSGIAQLLDFAPIVGEKSLGGAILRSILPEPKPEFTNIRNFYGDRFGLDSIGRVASGIMKGYNPVSGGFLNTITGGRFGQPTNYGLAGAMQRRIEKILGRKIAQTNASREKIKQLRDLQLSEMKDRYDSGESLGSIGASTFSGPGMAFEAGNTDQGGGFTGGQVKDTGGVPGGKYGSPR